ncbi:MAG: hypothetical protein FWD34_06025 [Oscillospiraceae bacterium]|nr:hypothetical protein [Oscillospiraceae bacterium]
MSKIDDGFGLGAIHCDPEKVACRTCKNALKTEQGYTKATCSAYDGEKTGFKPEAVYFENADCEAYAEGEDLYGKT